MQSQRQAREITTEFFANLRHRQPGITLDEAILRFENGDEFDNLDDFATSKSRTGNSYREAYSEHVSRICFFPSINPYMSTDKQYGYCTYYNKPINNSQHLYDDIFFLIHDRVVRLDDF